MRANAGFPVRELTAAERTEHAEKSFDQRRQIIRNRERIKVLQQMFGRLACTYCRMPLEDNTVLFPVILSHRPGFACKSCIKKFLL